MKKTLALALLMAFLVPVSTQAKEYTFDVNAKYVNITFESQMAVEDIVGSTNTVKGSFNWISAEKGSFELKVPVATLKTGIDMRDDHLRSEGWLSEKKNPYIVFKGDKIKKTGDTSYELTGTFNLAGKTQEKTITVDIREVPDSLVGNLGGGDWIRVRGEFSVKLSDHGVKIPDMAAAKVNDVWTVKISLFAKGK